MPAAIGSKKAAVENKNDMQGAFVIREPDQLPLAVCQFKIGRRFQLAKFTVTHTVTSEKCFFVKGNIKKFAYIVFER